MDALDSLGYDLVLLSLSPSDGKLTTAQRLGFGLMGSELVRLAAAGRVTIDGGRVEVIDAAPGQAGQDPFLDEALASLSGSRRAARAKSWVSRPRRGMAEAYLERLAATGTLQAERSTRLGIFPVTRWRIADAGRHLGRHRCRALGGPRRRRRRPRPLSTRSLSTRSLSTRSLSTRSLSTRSLSTRSLNREPIKPG
jgi:Golgi phosphoprotein 3 (GPP34)